MTSQYSKSRQIRQFAQTALAPIGLVSLVTGCTTALAQGNQPGEIAKASANVTAPALPTLRPTATPLAPTPTPLPQPTATPWPTPTLWPTPTPWPTPAAWRPTLPALPTLAPVPVVMGATTPNGIAPVSYSPPNGVDVFGSTPLRWTFYDLLAEDEFFDIKIRPYGSNDSVFVDWSKTPEYELHPWSGWQPGLYTWQIGIVKGYKEGDAKHFIADTGRDSQAFLIKWQAAGGGGGGGGQGGGSAGGGGGGGGGRSGGS